MSEVDQEARLQREVIASKLAEWARLAAKALTTARTAAAPKFDALKRASVREAQRVKDWGTAKLAEIRADSPQTVEAVPDDSERWWRQGWQKLTQPGVSAKTAALIGEMDGVEFPFHNLIEAKTHALLQLRTAARLGCEAEIQLHAQQCVAQGWPMEFIHAARNGIRNPGFSEQENLLLRYADDIARTPTDVDLQTSRELRRHFTQPQIAEITASICYENFRARYRNALSFQTELTAELEAFSRR